VTLLTISHEVALIAVLTLAIIVLVLFVLLLLQREVANVLTAYRRRREVLLTPLVHQALDDPDAVPPLRRALRRFDHLVLREMLVRLALDLRGEEAVRITRVYRELGLLDRELARLGGWGWRRRASAAQNLGTLRIAATLPALQPALGDRHVHVRLAAVRAIGDLETPEALVALVPMLGDPSPAVSRQAQAILAERGGKVAREIRSYLRTTGNRRGRLAAVELLGWHRAPEATPLLLDLVAADDPELRVKAVKAAAAIGDPRCLELFHALLEDPAWEVRCHAAKGLGLLGSPESVPALRARLADRQWWVRYHAAVALAELGGEGQTALGAAQADPEPRVADMARYIVERVSPAAPVFP
jgi:HEAT repeat protein